MGDKKGEYPYPFDRPSRYRALDPCRANRSKRQHRTGAPSNGRASLSEADRPAPASSVTASHVADHQPFQCAPARRTAAELQARTLHTGWRSSAGCVPLKSNIYSSAQSPGKHAVIYGNRASLAMPRAVSDGALCGPALVELADSDYSGRTSDAGERISIDSSAASAAERSSICSARQLSHGNLGRYGGRPVYTTSSACGSLDSARPSSDGARSSYEKAQRRSFDLGRSSAEWQSCSDASEQSEGASYALPAPSLRQYPVWTAHAAPSPRGQASALPPASVAEGGPPCGPPSLRLATGTRRRSIEGLSEQSSDGGQARLRHVSSASAFPAAATFPTPATFPAAALRVAKDADCCGDSGAVGLLVRVSSLRTTSEPMCSGSEADDASCGAASPGIVPSVRRDSFPHALHERKTVRWNLEFLCCNRGLFMSRAFTLSI